MVIFGAGLAQTYRQVRDMNHEQLGRREPELLEEHEQLREQPDLVSRRQSENVSTTSATQQ